MSKEMTLYQYGTLAGIMSAVYEGDLDVQTLLEQGDFGIGTINHIDGEVTILDGVAYHITGDTGEVLVNQLATNTKIPYGAVVAFNPQVTQALNQPIASDQLEKTIQEGFGSHNHFYAVKISGIFSHMHVRMAPKTTDNKPFDEVASEQPDFIRQAISGTIVGFWTPSIFNGVSAGGYHLHFISDAHDFGGHVMDYNLLEGQVTYGQIDRIIQDLPTTSAFQTTAMDPKVIHDAIEASE